MDTEHRHPEDERIAAVAAAIQALDTPAPASLRTSVEAAAAKAEAEQRRGGAGRFGGLRPGALLDVLGALRPRTLAAVGGGAVAVLVALVLVVVLAGGAAAPSVPEVAGVALRGATAPAPAPATDGHLHASVKSVSFPDWSGWTRGPGGSWRATGARSDEVGDRTVHTVFYANHGGDRIGYAIADGGELPAGSGEWAKYDGRPMWIYEVDGQPAVMWYRDGLTCVVSGRGVDLGTLKDLAAAHTT